MKKIQMTIHPHLMMMTRTITTLKRRKTKEQVHLSNQPPDQTQSMVMTVIMQKEKKLRWKLTMKIHNKMKMRRQTLLILMKVSNNLILW